jgi:molybdenum cofactor cytidylyltransferase
MLLPWGKSTVLEKVIGTFLNAGIEDVLVITGGAQEQVQGIISQYPVRTIHNANFALGEMLSSIQCGLGAMPTGAQATLIGLGDQPQVQERTVSLIREQYRVSQSSLIVPSFQMRRGHPWLVARPLWSEILALNPPESTRDFLTGHSHEIHYVNVDTQSILTDLDTPEDYEKSHPA